MELRSNTTGEILYGGAFPALNKKSLFLHDLLLSVEEAEQLIKMRFKPSILVASLESVAAALASHPSVAPFFAAPFKAYGKRATTPDIRYRVDGLEYTTVIIKNTRTNPAREIFELKVSNDGFFYKPVKATEDFERAGSKSWTKYTDSLPHIMTGLEKVVALFPLGDNPKFVWYYNSQVMRMDIIIQSQAGDKELTISFEPKYPCHDAPADHFVSYNELRRQNLQLKNDAFD